MSTLQGSPEQDPTSRSRKAHRKSRAGCSNCKQKRIKCDESKPSCSNCIRRFDRCSFLSVVGDSAQSSQSVLVHRPASVTSSATLQNSNPSSPADQSASSFQSDEVQFADFELLHNFLMKTGPSFVSDNNASELYYWQTQLPQIAFQTQHIMFLVLSISALHMYQTKPARPHFISRAESLYGLALPIVIRQLPLLSADNCEMLYVCSTLICFYHFARGPAEGQFIAFSDNGMGEWFLLLRGVRTIMDQYRDVLMDGILAGSTHLPNAQFQGTSTPARPRITRSKDSLERLTAWLQGLAAQETSFEKYLESLDQLTERFDEFAKLRRGRPEFPIVFGWLYRLSTDYIEALQAKKPVALVIFAYFCILLREAEEQRWVLKGWSAHALMGVIKHLHPDYHQWIERPKEVVM